jgi:type II secretory pathway pseudopilin PulG
MKPEARHQMPETGRPAPGFPPSSVTRQSALILSPSAFTLVEILVALGVMTLVCAAAFSLLASVSKAWQRGTALSRDLHAGDFVIEQITGALRSARYRDGNDGMLLKKSGLGTSAQDSLSWVKEGSDLVGSDSTMAKSFHRIRLWVGRDRNGHEGALYTAWGDAHMQPDDFDPDQLAPEILSDRVVGLGIRVATNNFENDTIEWMEDWEGKCPLGGDLTNHLPRFVEVTLLLKPLDEGDPPIEMRRLVDIPIAREGMR